MIEEVRRTWQFFRDSRPEMYGDLDRDSAEADSRADGATNGIGGP